MPCFRIFKAEAAALYGTIPASIGRMASLMYVFTVVLLVVHVLPSSDRPYCCTCHGRASELCLILPHPGSDLNLGFNQLNGSIPSSVNESQSLQYVSTMRHLKLFHGFVDRLLVGPTLLCVSIPSPACCLLRATHCRHCLRHFKA